MISLSELGYKVAAKYPIIHINTHEEERFLHFCKGQFGGDHGRKIWEWSATEGLYVDVKKGGDTERTNTPETEDFVQALVKIKKLALEKEGEKLIRQIIVVKDVHPYIEYPIVRRHIRDLSVMLPHTNTTLFLLGAELKIPTDLEKAIAVYDFPLPDEEELLNLATAVQHNNRHKIKPLHKDDHLLKMARACLGLTRDEAENAMAKSAAKLCKLDLGEVAAEKREILKKAGLEVREPKKKLADLGGLDMLKDYIQRVNHSRVDPESRNYGVPFPKGIALLGPPGNGKSAIVDGIAAEFEVALVVFDMGQMQGSLVGESQSRMRSALARINAIGNCVVRFDELEKQMGGMTGPATDSGVKQELGGMLLTWLQERPEGSYVVATMNRVIDRAGGLLVLPEMLRKGRWDELWVLDLPHEQQRVEIAAIHLKNRGRKPTNFDLEEIAKVSEGFSGAEIETAITDTLFQVFPEGREINTDDVVAAIKRTSPISLTMKEEIDALRAWAKSRNIRAASTAAKVKVNRAARTVEA